MGILQASPAVYNHHFIVLFEQSLTKIYYNGPLGYSNHKQIIYLGNITKSEQVL